MRNIAIIFLFLVILCFAVVGCLYIFEVKTWDESVAIFMKAAGAIVLLGICTAAVKVLMNMNKGTED